MSNLDSRLNSLASEQFGYFTSKQAVEVGFPTSRQTLKVHEGSWLRISTGLYRLPGFEDTFTAGLLRWLLWSRNQNGDIQGVISHNSALQFFDLYSQEERETTVHLIVPKRFRKKKQPGCTVHKAEIRRDEFLEDGLLRVTLPLRTLLDIKNTVGDSSYMDWLTQKAIEDNLLTGDEARRENLLREKIANIGVFAFSADQAASELPDDNSKIAVVVANSVSEVASEVMPTLPLKNHARPSGPPDLELPPVSLSLEEGETKVEVDADSKENDFADIVAKKKSFPILARLKTVRTEPSRWANGSSSAAFTLVELLVVIAIISVLCALLMPALTRSMAIARQIACANNMKNLDVAWTQYVDDFDGHPMVVTPWIGSVAPYSSNWYMFLIAEGYVDETNWSNFPYTSKPTGIYRCPSESRTSANGQTFWQTWMGGHYAMNWSMVNAYQSASNPRAIQQWVSIRAIPKKSQISLLGDKAPPANVNYGRFSYTALGNESFRHSGGWNVVFLDGHLCWLSAYQTPHNPPNINAERDVFYGDYRGGKYNWW